MRAARCPTTFFSSSPAATSVATLLRQLRETTGAPMVDCKAALVAESNDISKATDWLRKKGLSAVKKAEGRVASQGLIAFSLNGTSSIGALVEVRDVFPAPPLFFTSFGAWEGGRCARTLHNWKTEDAGLSC
jgi:hypothetical protein